MGRHRREGERSHRIVRAVVPLPRRRIVELGLFDDEFILEYKFIVLRVRRRPTQIGRASCRERV